MADTEAEGVVSQREWMIIIALLIPTLCILYWLSTVDYLFFHVMVEQVSIVIGFCIFAFTITSRKVLDGYLVIIGLGFFFFGAVDLLHTFAFKGMGFFTDDANLATQLWVIARYGQAVTFLGAALWIGKKVNAGRLFAIMAVVTIALVASAFAGIFPACYVDGVGLTLFKIVSEYIIIALLAVGMLAFYSRRALLDRRVMMLLLLSMAFSIFAEFSFTNYVSVYGFFNALGHLLKLVAALLIFMAIVEMGVSRPIASLFKRISDSENRYRSLLDTTPSLVVILDDKGMVQSCNRRMAEVISGSATVEAGVVQKAFMEVQLSDGVELTLKEGRAGFRADLMTPQGMRAILWNSVAERVSGERIVLISGIDITEREADRERIESLNDFIYVLNRIAMHDLRNRLVAINGMIDLYHKRNVPSDLQVAADNARAGAETLRRLEVLSRSVECRPEPSAKEVRKVVEEVVAGSGEKDHIIVVGHCQAFVDDAFPSVLENLVSNAFRHGQASAVVITMKQEDGKAVVTVADDGVGIPVEVKEKIFTSGFTHGSTGNTGMGLFIARKLVEGYGGGIEVMDNEPRGALFRIELPLPPSE